MSATDVAAAPPAMELPSFYADVPSIIVRDALADTLGAAAGGCLHYRYVDAVKLAGHSCPTVAGAWLMTRAALAHLYPTDIPRRGEMRVELREPQESGVTGVIASIAGLVTGAAGPGGFQGLAGRHGRRNLLAFGQPMRGELRVTRLDTGRSVEVSHHPQAVARPPALAQLMQAALAPDADQAVRAAFATGWQDWVRCMLVEHADDPALVSLQE
ncbi:hypothetical protein ACFPOE_05440 [Caenimonas terrae]|uniref:Formylmethanofuran dehydrogenase subunit E domain-containing protein n=1 Tax=Caenimonas terrae TaxID=696074 RepID=A0ABW0NAT5_9BURK